MCAFFCFYGKYQCLCLKKNVFININLLKIIFWVRIEFKFEKVEKACLFSRSSKTKYSLEGNKSFISWQATVPVILLIS